MNTNTVIYVLAIITGVVMGIMLLAVYKKTREDRAEDTHWKIVKYREDVMLYARCSCGFEYSCSQAEKGCRKHTVNESLLYNFCPICGSPKMTYSEDIADAGSLVRRYAKTDRRKRT